MRGLSLVRKHPEHTEGRTAKAIEKRTAQIPSDSFLWLAGASIAGALVVKAMHRENDAQFIGQWAPTLLILGLYNKIVKQLGHD
jgi:hypothetical protein